MAPSYAGLEVVPKPPASPTSPFPIPLGGPVICEQYIITPELDDTSSPRPDPRRGRRLCVLGLLIACMIGAVVGSVVVGTRYKHNGVQAKPSPGYARSHSPSLASTERAATVANPLLLEWIKVLLSLTSCSNLDMSGSIPTPKPIPFSPVYQQSDQGDGIGSYDLSSTTDRSFAFDYDHSGKLDHIVLYRPGHGAIFILKNDNGTFTPIYKQGEGGLGIGGYDLLSPVDRAFAFDYEHSGNLDYIVLYRPGSGTIWIVGNKNGSFFPVYRHDDGIGDYDLRSSKDLAFAFDNDHSGKLDHIALYRPGTGTIWILRNDNGNFSAVYRQGCPGLGIGGCDLSSTADTAFAFDYDHSGKMDHIVIYRPGKGSVWIIRHDGSIFFPVYQQRSTGNGIGGFDFMDPNDSAFAIDYGSTGKQDSLVLYRPGSGVIMIANNNNGTFTSVYGRGDSGMGIAGYNLKSSVDLGYAFDYRRNGKLDHIALYRPGAGSFCIVERV